MSKCTFIFLAGMVVTMTAMAFFGPMMQMPGQMMQMMNPTQQSAQPCECRCITE